jgi:acylphosphatase
MNIRGTFTITGVVQNVNYRETVFRKALGMGLKGVIRNQEDGSVRVVAEGDPKSVRALPALLGIRSGRISVEKVLAKYSRATGEFSAFIIDYGPGVTRGDLAVIEKLDEGYHIMREMNARLDRTNRSIGSVDSHITSMDRNIGRRFDRLDRSYGSFGRTLGTVSKDMKGMARDTKGVKASMTGLARDTKAVKSSTSRMAGDIRSLRQRIVADIKLKGKGRRYDCIVGVANRYKIQLSSPAR